MTRTNKAPRALAKIFTLFAFALTSSLLQGCGGGAILGAVGKVLSVGLPIADSVLSTVGAFVPSARPGLAIAQGAVRGTASGLGQGPGAIASGVLQGIAGPIQSAVAQGQQGQQGQPGQLGLPGGQNLPLNQTPGVPTGQTVQLAGTPANGTNPNPGAQANPAPKTAEQLQKEQDLLAFETGARDLRKDIQSSLDAGERADSLPGGDTLQS